MKKFIKAFSIGLLCLLMTWTGLRMAQAITASTIYSRISYQKQHWDVPIEAWRQLVVADLNSICTSVTSLGTTVANWVTSVDTPILINATPTYIAANSFTLPADYTSILTAGRRLLVDQGQDAAVGNTVVSAVYAAPNTTVTLTYNNLTGNIQAVSYYGTRSGTVTYGSGDILTSEYGSPSWANLQAAVAVANASGRRLVVTPGNWPITDDIVITAPVYNVPTGIFQVATTKTLTLNASFEAGLYQVFSCTGTGKVVFGPGAVKWLHPEWWGAVPDNSTICNISIQAAMTACSYTTGVGTVFLSAGQYKITTDLMVPIFTSIIGVSPDKTTIEANGCNGLVFDTSVGATSLGTKIFSGFTINGTSCGTKSGMTNTVPASLSYKVEGLDITNIRISNFGWGMKWMGLWNSRIHDNVYIYPCDVAIAIWGKSVSNVISGVNLEYAAVVGSAGAKRGIDINSVTYGDGSNPYPEALTINGGTSFYNFDRAISHNLGSQIFIDHCFLGECVKHGILTNGASNNGFSITNCWIQMASTTGAVYGIRSQGAPVGGPFHGQNIIRDCQISGYGAVANQYGISLENNAFVWIVEGNTLFDFTEYDIFLSGISSYGMVNVAKNDCRDGKSIAIVSTAAQSTINVDDNKFVGPVEISATNSGIINIGRNNGTYSTYVKGYTTIASGNTTGTTIFATMYGAPPNWANSGTYGVYPILRILGTENVDLGRVYGTCDGTKVDITCTTAPGANKRVYWEVVAYTLKDLGW